jgi:hypothetical protein
MNAIDSAAMRLVIKWVNGRDVSKRGLGYDISAGNGTRIEVKGSNLSGTDQWKFSHLLGNGQRVNVYDQLIAVGFFGKHGVKIFDIPYKWVQDHTAGDNKHRLLQVGFVNKGTERFGYRFGDDRWHPSISSEVHENFTCTYEDLAKYR